MLPFNITLLLLAVKVPLFDQFPLTVKVFEPLITSEPPVLVVKFPTVSGVEIVTVCVFSIVTEAADELG